MLELKEKQKNDFRIVQSNPPISMVRYSRLDGEITFTVHTSNIIMIDKRYEER